MGAFSNKGDQLMFYAIIDRFKNHTCCVNYGSIPYKTAKENQIYFAFFPKSINKIWNLRFIKNIIINFINALPFFITKAFRIIPIKKIDVIIDASGFAYGDKWGKQKLINAYNLYSNINRANLIFLPQSFGPFKNPDTIKWIEKLLKNAKVVYARDSISFKYLSEFKSDAINIKQAPDFTFKVNFTEPAGIGLTKNDNYAAVIPNHRLIMKENGGHTQKYISYLENIVKILISKKLKVILVTHDSVHDFDLAKILSQKFNKKVEIIRLSDAREIRYIIANAKLIVSSRFHGLINGLTQNVPVIGFGWTHKFKALLNEYDLDDYLINYSTSIDDIELLISTILDNQKGQEIIQKIKNNLNIQSTISEDMWLEVTSIIEDN